MNTNKHKNTPADLQKQLLAMGFISPKSLLCAAFGLGSGVGKLWAEAKNPQVLWWGNWNSSLGGSFSPNDKTNRGTSDWWNLKGPLLSSCFSFRMGKLVKIGKAPARNSPGSGGRLRLRQHLWWRPKPRRGSGLGPLRRRREPIRLCVFVCPHVCLCVFFVGGGGDTRPVFRYSLVDGYVLVLVLPRSFWGLVYHFIGKQGVW